MTERIRELAEQAEDYSYTEYAKKQTGYTREDFFKLKFAELIVKECLEQIYSVTIDNPTDDWDQGYDSGLDQAAETIKTHFGV